MGRKNKVRTNIVEWPVELSLPAGDVRQGEVASEVYTMLGCYARWLNAAGQLEKDRMDADPTRPVGADGKVIEWPFSRVRVEEFWLEAGDSEVWREMGYAAGTVVDSPTIKLDARWGGKNAGELEGSWETGRVIVMTCSPFHDEGGNAELMARFTYEEDGGRSVWATLGLDSDGEVEKVEIPRPGWVLDSMTAEFDTQTSLIVTEGKVVNPAWEIEGTRGSLAGTDLFLPDEK